MKLICTVVVAAAVGRWGPFLVKALVGKILP